VALRLSSSGPRRSKIVEAAARRGLTREDVYALAIRNMEAESRERTHLNNAKGIASNRCQDCNRPRPVEGEPAGARITCTCLSEKYLLDVPTVTGERLEIDFRIDRPEEIQMWTHPLTIFGERFRFDWSKPKK
jgi:hypothetical protein